MARTRGRPISAPAQGAQPRRGLADFRETGSRCLIVPAVIETSAELDMLESAVGADVFMCRLTAPDHTLADRIRDRGREFGDDLPKLEALG